MTPAYIAGCLLLVLRLRRHFVSVYMTRAGMDQFDKKNWENEHVHTSETDQRRPTPTQYRSVTDGAQKKRIL